MTVMSERLSRPPSRGDYPTTMWTEILSLRDPRSPEFRLRMNGLIQRYWKPVFHTIRAWWSKNEEQARDLTQEFFLRMLDGPIVAVADPARGTFRHYLEGCLRHFILNEIRSEKTVKRGGR